MPLLGRALVTGGGRGIGANIARELAAAGMRVIVTARTQEQVDAVAARDRRSRARRRRLAARTTSRAGRSEAGEVDLLVCNAGISGPSEPLGDPDEWWRTFEVNVLGVYLCCNASRPGMVERGGGRIVNVASGAAYLPPRADAADGVRGEQGGRPPVLRAARGRRSRRRTSSSSRSAPAS